MFNYDFFEKGKNPHETYKKLEKSVQEASLKLLLAGERPLPSHFALIYSVHARQPFSSETVHVSKTSFQDAINRASQLYGSLMDITAYKLLRAYELTETQKSIITVTK